MKSGGFIRLIPVLPCPWCKEHRDTLTEEQLRDHGEALNKLISQEGDEDEEKEKE